MLVRGSRPGRNASLAKALAKARTLPVPVQCVESLCKTSTGPRQVVFPSLGDPCQIGSGFVVQPILLPDIAFWKQRVRHEEASGSRL